jgi:two-component system OmpR family response regulator
VWLDLLGEMLANAGYKHFRATRSDEALAMLRREPVDLFTQDWVRSGMDGGQLYEVLKTDPTLKRIPVLFVTGEAEEFFFDPEWRTVYGDDCVLKSAGVKKILEAVATVLRRHHKHLPQQTAK